MSSTQAPKSSKPTKLSRHFVFLINLSKILVSFFSLHHGRTKVAHFDFPFQAIGSRHTGYAANGHGRSGEDYPEPFPRQGGRATTKLMVNRSDDGGFIAICIQRKCRVNSL
ncbi:hypothetical protein SLEP1_g8847 [Rubroshorea leprosula]|uniref:Uncharacterized protein n=1 Tax=Rubroshorea leprosula TaxID=152421 RepID=A0AAV5I8M5_9ROSI|nr:hypothetical protein SLEP1_g8847 [Rubroshorea leprosula]